MHHISDTVCPWLDCTRWVSTLKWLPQAYPLLLLPTYSLIFFSMSLQTCLACGCNNFTVTGLSQHLAKSHDSRCQALYRNSCSRTNPNPVNKTTKNFAPESGHPKVHNLLWLLWSWRFWLLSYSQGNYSESISGYFEAEGDTPKVHNSTYFGYFETEGLILHSQGEDSGSDDHPVSFWLLTLVTWKLKVWFCVLRERTLMNHSLNLNGRCQCHRYLRMAPSTIPTYLRMAPSMIPTYLRMAPSTTLVRTLRLVHKGSMDVL